MIGHVSPRLASFVVAVSFLASGCASVAIPNDSGPADVTGTDSTAVDSSFVCPADPSTLVGHACANPNVTCGHCSDPCSFCNVVQCVASTWSPIEIFPGQCDGGTDVAQDATPTPCGTTACAGGEVCVHTVAGGGPGGPCRVPEDGGCGPNETLSGGCCIYQQEWYRCAAVPAACQPAITCGCVQALCDGDAGPSCPCTTADSSHVECGCFYP